MAREYVCDGQGVHTPLVAFSQLPAGHAQEVAPVAPLVELPSGHTMHVVESILAENVSTGQGEHVPVVLVAT